VRNLPATAVTPERFKKSMAAITDTPQFANLTGDSIYEPDRVFASLRDQNLAKPFFVAQLGQTLDGRIATIDGDSRGIGGQAGLEHLHRLRAHVDAILVGAGTIEIDDPQLNVRLFDAPNPARIVIDPRGRAKPGKRWLACDGARKVLISSQNSMPEGCDELIRLEGQEGQIAPALIAGELFKRGYKKLLVEGGTKTIAGFLRAGMLDRLHVVISPVIFGSGLNGIDLPPIKTLAEALRPPTTAYLLGGGEVLFDCDMKSQNISS